MSLSKQTKEINRKTIAIQSFPEFLGQNAQYKIDLKNTITEFSSDLVTAYMVLQTNATNVNSDLYAIVSKMPQTVELHKFSCLISMNKINNVFNIIDYGITNIDGKEHFAIVLPYLKPERAIKNYLHIFKSKQDIVLQQIIIPILETLVQMHNAEITHSCINNENVFVEVGSDGNVDRILLSNTILEPSGYNQNGIFEPINRMLVHRAGKYSGNKAADCYAVGMLLMSLIAGEQGFKSGYEAILSSKVKNGSYATVLEQWFGGDDKNIDQALKCIAYWLLNDNEEKRWDAVQSLKFLRRRHRKFTISNAIKAMQNDIAEKQKNRLSKPVLFSSEECFSFDEAAISSIRHYEEIKLKVKNGKLIHALLKNSDVSAKFISKVSLLRTAASHEEKDISKEELFLTFLIILLNNKMPIKIRDLTVEFLGIWQMLNYVVSKQVLQLSNTLHKVISSGLIKTIYETTSKICNVQIPQGLLKKVEKIEEIIFSLKEHDFSATAIANFISYYIEDHMFTNKSLDHKICFDNVDALEVINSFDQKAFDEVLSDENLLCFILSGVFKTPAASFKRIKTTIIDTTADEIDRALIIFSLAHKSNYEERPLKGIAENLLNKIKNKQLKDIKNLVLRNKIEMDLNTAAQEGNISLIWKILQSREIDKKNNAYSKVIQRVENLKSRVCGYKKQMYDLDTIREAARNTTVKVAGSVFLGTVLMIFYNLFWL